MRTVSSLNSGEEFTLTGVIGNFAILGVQSVQKSCENGRQGIAPDFIAAPPTLGPLPEVDAEDDIPFFVGDGLEYTRFRTEWTGPIPLNECFEVRVWVVCADKG